MLVGVEGVLNDGVDKSSVQFSSSTLIIIEM